MGKWQKTCKNDGPWNALQNPKKNPTWAWTQNWSFRNKYTKIKKIIKGTLKQIWKAPYMFVFI